MKKYKAVLSVCLVCLFSCSVTAQSMEQGPPVSSEAARPFVPDGFEVLFNVSGDLNLDGLTDAILVLRQRNEREDPDSTIIVKRPVLLLTGQPDGKYKLALRTDNLVFDAVSGGMFEALQQILISNGHIYISQSGGVARRWDRSLSFKYDPVAKTWMLTKDEHVTYEATAFDKRITIIHTPKDFGRMTIGEFDGFKTMKIDKTGFPRGVITNRNH